MSDEPVESTILVTSCMPDPLEQLGLLLADAGYRVFKAPDTDAALNIAQRERLDLVLCHRSADKNGREMWRLLRETPSLGRLPVLVIGGDGGVDQGVISEPAGAVDFLE